jgi:hypothetical protein
MSERWLPVVGWEGYYEVSDVGRVRSVERIVIHSTGGPTRIRERILSQFKTPRGHLNVALCRDSTKMNRTAHQLVIEAFVGPRPEGMECRHLNGDPADNRPENLMWGTASENTYDQVGHGTHVQARKTHCATCELPYDAANTYRSPTGKRHCRNCRNRINREIRARKKTQTRRAA